MGAVPYRRAARQPGPQPPRGELVLESPPELPEQVPPNAARFMMILPMVAGAGAMAFMYAGRGGGPLTYVVGGLFGVSMLGMVLVSLTTGGGNKQAETNAERRDYMRYLAQSRRRIRKAAEQQRAALEWQHPAPDALWSIAASRRLWERAVTDDDFGDVRIAVGVQRSLVQLVTPETKPVEDLEPMSALALRRFVRTHAVVPALPVAMSLRVFSRVAMHGDRSAVLALTRAVVAQLATLQAPSELMIVVVAAPERRPEWDWVKWLPHAQHPREMDGGGEVRLVFTRLAAAEAALAEELAARSRHRPDGRPPAGAAHLVVVLDGGEVSPQCQLLGPGLEATTVLDLSGLVPRRSARWLLSLEVTATELRMHHDGAVTSLGRPDRLGRAQVEALARQLSPYRSPAGTSVGEESRAGGLELPELLGIGDAAALDPAVTWQPRPPRDRLRIPLGTDPAGNVVELDVKESAQGGMGPHGLCIGATGSGKSELLRTVVAALAARHSSEELNFVLVDFKGGATFASLDVLPHTSAVITNLADELPLVDRMKDALAGELVRRQEALRAAGNYVSRYEYELARAGGEPLAPMPSLLIICDEFSELLTAKPDFIDLFVMIGRLGRSLGVHLLLASQRLEEGRLRGLDTHLSYRIGLRTFSAAESRTVLGVQDAYELPSAPGHGYLRTGTQTLLRFRAAYVSGPYRQRVRVPASPAVLEREVVAFHTGAVPLPAPVEPAVEPDPDPVPDPAAEPGGETGKQPSQLDILVDRMRDRGRPAHQVWLPPLGAPPALDELLPPLVVDPVSGLGPGADWPGRGRLTVPVGVVDRPYEQRRDPFLVELSGSGGNAVIVGGPQSGKSTLLRTMLAALALTHTPAEVQLFCLDFGGGALRSLDGLPHLSGVAGRRDTEAVRRTVAEVVGLLDARETRFAAAGVDSVATYRRRRATGQVTDDPYGDVFLVIDGWSTVREEFESLESTITNLAARGLGYGIHVVLTAARWAEVRMNLRDMLGTKLELRLGDPGESDIDRRAAANVPEKSPGRGLTREKLHFLTAVSRLDGSSEVADLADATGELVRQVRAGWPGPAAPRVRMLPRLVHRSELASMLPADPPGVPIGLDESQLAPVLLDLATEPHLIVFGDAECGKTNLLRVIARSVVERFPADQARLVIADFRRGLLGTVEGDHLLEYAPSGQALAGSIPQLRDALLNRLPGPEVTPAQLRARDWWRGPEVYLLVDDYDLVVTAGGNPLLPLLELLPQARDIGLHVILARRCGGVSRALYEPFLQRLRELDTPGLLMSGSREEGQIFGSLRPSPQPPGRGTLVRRRDGAQLIQTVWVDP